MILYDNLALISPAIHSPYLTSFAVWCGANLYKWRLSSSDRCWCGQLQIILPLTTTSDECHQLVMVWRHCGAVYSHLFPNLTNKCSHHATQVITTMACMYQMSYHTRNYCQTLVPNVPDFIYVTYASYGEVDRQLLSGKLTLNHSTNPLIAVSPKQSNVK